MNWISMNIAFKCRVFISLWYVDRGIVLLLETYAYHLLHMECYCVLLSAACINFTWKLDNNGAYLLNKHIAANYTNYDDNIYSLFN